jgi:CubicO group peptidase (beta-lactamase class C family)
MDVEAAAAYAERHALHALVVQQGSTIAFERYGAGYDAATPHPLYSGTKSFWGVLAVAAQDDGLLALDEPVAATVPAWAADPRKSRVTLRELLQLTSGIGFGGLGRTVPTYDKALAVELVDEPGERFTYGGIPLQVFGAVLARKLAPRDLTPHAYLEERILDPIGLHVGAWRTLSDGTHPLPTGASIAAAEWLKYGRLICARGVWGATQVVAADSLAACFRGSRGNPRYGLGWWLASSPAAGEIAYASGAAGQALYVIPALDTVVVKFGGSASYKHDAFLKRLLEAPAAGTAPKPRKRRA